MAEPLHEVSASVQTRKGAEGYQFPDPTTVTLCFCSWEPSVAIALAPDKLGVASSGLEECELRIEAEMLMRRRRAARLGVAMLAVSIGN